MVKEETKLIRVSLECWKSVKKAVSDYEFDMGDLIEWILDDVDLDEYAKNLEMKAEESEDYLEDEDESEDKLEDK